MTRQCLIALAALALATSLQAEVRTFRGQKGESIKAEFASVLGGKVVLKVGRKRVQQNITDFSLADRDYICGRLKKRPEKILELMQGIKNVKVPEKPLEAAETKFYDMTMPSIGMLEPKPRTFTDLTGNQVTASFEQLIPPFHVRLRSDGRSETYPLVFFISEDIEHIRQAIKTDAEKEIFPPDSSTEVKEGYKLFTDRRGVQLAGKIVDKTDGKVTIESNGTTKTWPIAGLSKDDRRKLRKRNGNWDNGNRKRNGNNNNGKNSEGNREKRNGNEGGRGMQGGNNGNKSDGSNGTSGGMNQGGNNRGGNNSNGSPNRSGSPGGSPMPGGSSSPGNSSSPGGPGNENANSNKGFATVKFQFHCNDCQHHWTSGSSTENCPNCEGSYKFQCNDCGHSWKLKKQAKSTCPKCSGSTSKKPVTSTFNSGMADSLKESESTGSSAAKAGQITGLVIGLLMIVGSIVLFVQRQG